MTIFDGVTFESSRSEPRPPCGRGGERLWESVTQAVLVRVSTDLGGFLTRENAEDFLVGPALTLALVPLLYAVAWYSRRELANLRRQFSF